MARVMRMTPLELGLWQEHLDRHPLGEDRRLQALVGQIYVLLCYWSGAASKTRPIDLYDVAPWLRTPEQARAAEEARGQAFVSQLYAMAYQPIMEA